MNKSRNLVFLFLVSFIGIIVLSGFCMAMEKHSCCQPKVAACPIMSVQKASTPKSSKLVKPATDKRPITHRTEYPTAIHESFVSVVDCWLPHFYLTVIKSHLTTAPPRA